MKTLKSTLRNESGFTLGEMMLVTLLLSVAVLGAATYITFLAKQNKAAENKQSTSQLKGAVINAAAQGESLVASESLQFKDNGHANDCPPPCYLGIDPASPSNQEACVFDTQRSGTPPSTLPSGCKAI